ncbi:hypothetical protein LXL04_026070 [Taraxacum kok-saghyz]
MDIPRQIGVGSSVGMIESVVGNNVGMIESVVGKNGMIEMMAKVCRRFGIVVVVGIAFVGMLAFVEDEDLLSRLALGLMLQRTEDTLQRLHFHRQRVAAHSMPAAKFGQRTVEASRVRNILPPPMPAHSPPTPNPPSAHVPKFNHYKKYETRAFRPTCPGPSPELRTNEASQLVKVSGFIPMRGKGLGDRFPLRATHGEFFFGIPQKRLLLDANEKPVVTRTIPAQKKRSAYLLSSHLGSLELKLGRTVDCFILADSFSSTPSHLGNMKRKKFSLIPSSSNDLVLHIKKLRGKQLLQIEKPSGTPICSVYQGIWHAMWDSKLCSSEVKARLLELLWHMCSRNGGNNGGIIIFDKTAKMVPVTKRCGGKHRRQSLMWKGTPPRGPIFAAGNAQFLLFAQGPLAQGPLNQWTGQAYHPIRSCSSNWYRPMTKLQFQAL